MARARNIKPKFFHNADLLELPFETRLLFAGLWTIVDREGRMEYRPKQIKIDIFPADNVDIASMVQALCKSGFTAIYTVSGKAYLQVLKFGLHQNPHKDEKKSEIPSMEHADLIEENTSTVQARCKHGATSEVIGLIPDSLLLIPDSRFLIADTGFLNPDKHKPKKTKSTPSAEIFQKPESVSQQVWGEFIALRKEKRAVKMTERVMSGIEREANKAGYTLENALIKCLEKQWQSFEASWVAADKVQATPYALKGKIISDRNDEVLASYLAKDREREIDVTP
jgi:hypothetical protein